MFGRIEKIFSRIKQTFLTEKIVLGQLNYFALRLITKF